MANLISNVTAGKSGTASFRQGLCACSICTHAFKAFGITSAEIHDYSFDKAIDHVASIPILTAGIVAGTFAIGIADWKWGTASFHFTNEGFFGKDTHDLGMDKLGHAFGTYVLTDLFIHAVAPRPPTLAGDPPRTAPA